MDVGYIPEPRLEQAAEQLIAEYGQRFEAVADPEIPVEEMLECLLGWRLEFDNLIASSHLPDAIGAIYLRSRRVVVDASLDPSEHPEMEGRYRFTLGHEIGHIRLHCPMLDEGDDAGDGETILCREAKSKKPRSEWQADRFSSYLLMPTALVRAAWREVSGGDDCLDTSDTKGKFQACDHVHTLSGLFHVSFDAMKIRLVTMNLLSQPSLVPTFEDFEK